METKRGIQPAPGGSSAGRVQFRARRLERGLATLVPLHCALKNKIRALRILVAGLVARTLLVAEVDQISIIIAGILVQKGYVAAGGGVTPPRRVRGAAQPPAPTTSLLRQRLAKKGSRSSATRISRRAARSRRIRSARGRGAEPRGQTSTGREPKALRWSAAAAEFG